MTTSPKRFAPSVTPTLTAMLAVIALLLGAGAALAQPTFVTNDLTSNRFNGIPNDTFQITTAYDGSTSGGPTLTLYFENVITGAWAPVSVGPLVGFTTQVETFEFDTTGWRFTCYVEVNGAVPNGSVDGLAFGFFWKDASGFYHSTRSNDSVTAADYFGVWPLAFTDPDFVNWTPQLSSFYGRSQARASISGAALMPNGFYCF